MPSWIIGSQNGSTLTSGVRNKEKQANAHKLMVIGLYTKSIWRRNGILLPTVRNCFGDQKKLLKFKLKAENFQKFWDH